MDNIITKEEWQSGDYRKREDCKTQKDYYESVEKFVNKYGKPIKDDILLCRSGYRDEEKKGFGCSFTTNVNVCRNLAKKYGRDTIWWYLVPKGTKAVYLPQKGCFEEEYVIPINIQELRPTNFGLLATLEGELDYMSSDYEVEGDFEKWKILPNQALGLLAVFFPKMLKKFGFD